MGEVFVNHSPVIALHQLQPLRGPLEGTDGLVKLLVAHPHLTACQPRRIEVRHVVLAENQHRHLTASGLQIGHPIANHVRMYCIRFFFYAFNLFTQYSNILIIITIDKRMVYHLGKGAERVHILGEGRENIDMVPRYTADNAHVRLVQVELGTAVDRRGEVLIALHHHNLRLVRQLHHHLETGQLRAHHVVAIHMMILQHMQNHCRNGGLAMTATHHNTELVLALLVQKFGIGIHLDTQLVGTNQFGIIQAGVHPQDDRIEVGRNLVGIPADGVGKESIFLQTAFGGIENLVVGTGNGVTFLVKGDGQIVHGATADGNKMYFHDRIF